MELTIKVRVNKEFEEYWAAGFADVAENHDLEVLVDMIRHASGIFSTASGFFFTIIVEILEDDLYNPPQTLGKLLDGSFGQKVPEETPILGVVDLVPLPENIMPTKCSACGNDFTPEDKLLVAIFGKDLQKALCIPCNEKDDEEPSITVNGKPLSEHLKEE